MLLEEFSNKVQYKVESISTEEIEAIQAEEKEEARAAGIEIG